tara:strand:- start:345 stop:809 length:465 start_codon:yes stop_codon:yes gene_type:complete
MLKMTALFFCGLSMNSKVNTTGFTLIELLIVVAIIAITTTLAYPSYERYIQDGRRSDAQQEMLQTAAILERIYSRNGGYPDSDKFTDLPNSAVYTFSYRHTNKPVGAANFRSLGFVLTATPKPRSAQASDRCAVLSINQAGETTASGNANDCWK